MSHLKAVTSVSITTKNTGGYAMIHTAFFYIPVNFVLNLPHYVSYMCHTGKKGSKKEFLKNKVTKNLLQGDSNQDPKNQLELKVNASHWTTSVNADK